MRTHLHLSIVTAHNNTLNMEHLSGDFGYSTACITDLKELEGFYEMSKQFLKDGFILRILYKAYIPQEEDDENKENKRPFLATDCACSQSPLLKEYSDEECSQQY